MRMLMYVDIEQWILGIVSNATYERLISERKGNNPSPTLISWELILTHLIPQSI